MPKTHTEKLIDWALQEDIGRGDITTKIFVPKNKRSIADIVTHQDATFVGFHIVKKIFQRLDPHIQYKAFFKDGDHVKAETKIIRVKGATQALLTGERVALNFLCHLSSVATQTTAFLDKVKPYPVKIMDTRKTTPGFRLLEKWAVRCAKGVNHRHDLSEMVLIKDNHHLVTRPNLSLSQMIKKARQKTNKPIEVEVETLEDFNDAFASRPDYILLDNMSLAQIKRIVALAKKSNVRPKPILEVSGGVHLKNIREIAKTGVDRISIGALTHTKKGINVSMHFEIN